MTVTQERNLKLNFSDSFIVVGQTVLLHPSLAGKVTSVEDLDDAGYRIAVTEGTTGEVAAKRFLAAARLSSFATPEEGVRQVVNGNADAFIHDAPYNLIALSRMQNSRLLLLEQPFTFEPLAFGLKKAISTASTGSTTFSIKWPRTAPTIACMTSGSRTRAGWWASTDR